MATIDIDRVRALYVQRQLSAREVSEQLGVSVWVVYKAMRRAGIDRRAPEESNAIRFERLPRSFSPRESLTNEEEHLKIAALMLYWAEGTKRIRPQHAVVDLANSDPAIHCIFLRFLRELVCIDEERLRAKLYCYSNQDVRELHEYWADVLGIPLKRFSKPFVRTDFQLKHQPMPHGLAHVVYADKKLLQYILHEIDRYRIAWAGTQVVNEVTL